MHKNQKPESTSFLLNPLEYIHSFVQPQTSTITNQSVEWLNGFVWLNGLVVSALGIRTRGPGFYSRVAPLSHWVATLGKLFTHIASPVSQLQETVVQKAVFGA